MSESAGNPLFQEILIEKNFSFEAEMRSGRAGEASDEYRHVGFIEVAPDDGQHHFGEVIFGGIKVKVVQREKDECGNSPCAFIAIDEGMVFHQVEQISRGHFKDVRVQKLTTVRGRRHSEGGFEQLDIANAGSTSIAGNLVLFDFQHLDQTEEDRVHLLLRQFLQSLGVPGVHLVESGLEGLAPAGVLYRAENEDLAVGGDVERRISVCTDQLEDRLFDHQGQTVSVFGKGLDYDSDLLCSLTHRRYRGTTSKRPGQGPLSMSAERIWVKAVRGPVRVGRLQGGYRSG